MDFFSEIHPVLNALHLSVYELRDEGYFISPWAKNKFFNDSVSYEHAKYKVNPAIISQSEHILITYAITDFIMPHLQILR